MVVRKNSCLVYSIISHLPIKWEVFLLIFFKRQSCMAVYHIDNCFHVCYTVFVIAIQYNTEMAVRIWK